MRQTLRQIVAVLALVGISMNLVPSALAATTVYSDEAAANKLAQLGIIVNKSATPSEYRLNDTVLRQEAVKVVAGALGGILENEANYSCTGAFSDIANGTWVCRIAELAKNAGLVAANPTFRPTAKLSKLEAIIFALRSAELMPAGNHSTDTILGFAVDAQLISSSAGFSVNAPATRGEFFRYVARALDASEIPDLCVAIPALCGNNNGNNNTGGAVSVSLGNSLSSGTQVPKAGTIKFATVNFTAGSNNVNLNTVSLAKAGLATIPTSTRVWFEKNGTRITGKAAFSSDGTAVIAFSPVYVVPANSTAALDLYVELNTTAGQDFQFTGTLSASSAASVSGSFSTPVLRTADYTVAPVVVATAGASLSANQSSDFVELGRFTVANADASAETRDIRLQNIMLRQGGTGDLVDLSDLRLERNGVVVSVSAVSNGKDVTFTVNDTIKDAATATYYIKGKVNSVQNNAGDTYIFSLRNSSDLNAVESATGFRSSVYTTLPTTFVAPTLQTYTITGADLVFARDTSVELAKSYAKGTNDVVLAKGTITAKSAVTLEDITLDYTSNVALNTDADDAFTTVYLQIGSSVMTWTADASGAAEFNGLATVSGTAEFKIWAKVKDNATLTSFKFEDFDLSDIGTKEYVSNQNTVTSAVGSIASVQVSIDTPALAITRTDGLGATTIAPGSTGVVVNTVSLAVSQGNDLVVATPVYTITSGGTLYQNNATATLYIDGTPVSTKTITSSTVSFDANRTITKTPKSMSVKVDFNSAFNTGTFSMRLTSLDITDALTSAAVSLPSVPTSAVFTIGTATGTASASDLNPDASAILAGAKDQKILAFRVKATNDNVKIRDLDFDGTNLGSLSNFRLLTPTGAYISATSNGASSVVFTNVSITDTIMMDKTDTYYLVADTNTNIDGTTFNVTLDVSSSQIKSTDGTISAVAGSDVASATHIIIENKAVVAKAANASKSLTTSALRFNVTASGEDTVTLNNMTFSNIFSGYTTTSAKVVVYKNSISAANKLGENTKTTATATSNAAGTVATVSNGGAGYTSVPTVTVSGGTCGTLPTATATVTNGVVTSIALSGALTCTVAPTLTVAAPGGNSYTGKVFLTANNTVDAGVTNSYVVVIEGIVVDPTSNSQDWNVSLSDVNFTSGATSINVASYENLGDLPITETK